VYVINTCTVTGRADFSDRQLIRRIARENPEAYLVVTGLLCPDRPGRGRPRSRSGPVVGNQEKYHLPDLLGSLTKRPRPRGGGGGHRGAREVPIAPLAALIAAIHLPAFASNTALPK